MKKIVLLIVLFYQISFLSLTAKSLPYLKVSKDGHFLMTENGEPFFWLGDTGWLMAQKLNQEDVLNYLEDRSSKGFNVIQMKVLNHVRDCNFYGDSALVQGNVVAPYMTNGNDFRDYIQYDYWDNIEWIVDVAAKKGIYVAVAPMWGSVIEKVGITKAMSRIYINLLCRKLGDRTNVIWMIGGDINGDEFQQEFNEMGLALKEHNSKQLITFLPKGGQQSSTWFQNDSWLDINMIHSGTINFEHLINSQSSVNLIAEDYKKMPTKPSLDGQAIYEGLAQNLNELTKKHWTAADVRKSAYSSVFSGACGFTYGNNSVMQFYRKRDKKPLYGAKEEWMSAVNNAGAYQMIYLKNLILSKPYFDRIPDQSLLADDANEKSNYIVATRGKDYAFLYTPNARPFSVNMWKVDAAKVKATWYNPKNGQSTFIGVYDNVGVKAFDPPGNIQAGNDWVLVLEKD